MEIRFNQYSMQKYLFVNKNQTVTTKIEWLYTVSQTYLNIYFLFFVLHIKKAVY